MTQCDCSNPFGPHEEICAYRRDTEAAPLCADCLARGREVPAEYWRGGVHPQCANCNAGNEDTEATA